MPSRRSEVIASAFSALRGERKIYAAVGMKRAGLSIVFGLAAACVTACALVLGVNDVDYGGADASALDASGSEGGFDSGDSPNDVGRDSHAPVPSRCSWIEAGPVRIEIDDAGYCIDSTEVTQAQYQLFLSAKAGDAGGQISECSGNVDYQPIPGAACTGNRFDPLNGDYPVTCIDWCDAVAYCAWAGGRLCGRVGGGPLAQRELPTSVDEWYRACAHGIERTFPYGDAYDASACNGAHPGDGAAAPVGSPSCQGGFPGIFDMSGNAAEWEDFCRIPDGGVNQCEARGGGWGAPESQLRCDGVNNFSAPTTRAASIGIRCCASL